MIPGCLHILSYLSQKLAESRIDIILHQFFQDLIPFHLRSQASCALVACNIGRITRHDIADDLVDRVVSLFRERLVNLTEDLTDLQFFIFLYRFKILCITDIARCISVLRRLSARKAIPFVAILILLSFIFCAI